MSVIAVLQSSKALLGIVELESHTGGMASLWSGVGIKS